MSQATIPLTGSESAPDLFGIYDRNLKQVREALDVRVVLRKDAIHVRGEEKQVSQALQIFDQLGKMTEKIGTLNSNQVEQIIHDICGHAPHSGTAIELLNGIRQLTPRTKGQHAYLQAVRDHEITLCVGPAGSGKTYIAVAMAVNALRNQIIRKIVLVRPAVEAGEKLGYLPGDIQAKVNPYQRPLLDALHEMIEQEKINRYLDNDVIEIIPLAYMRGRTLNESFIILDEGQNTTVSQMKMFLTRMGMGSRIVVTGDITQIDLPPHTQSGLQDAIKRLQSIPGIAVVHLNQKDIVRHPLVQNIVRAYDPRSRSKTDN